MVDSALASTYSSVNAFWRKGLVGPAPAVAVDAATPQADSAADTATNATDTVDDVAASTSASGEGDDAATDGVDGAGDASEDATTSAPTTDDASTATAAAAVAPSPRNAGTKAYRALRDVAVVSVAAGLMDLHVYPDHTSTAGLVPLPHTVDLPMEAVRRVALRIRCVMRCWLSP